MIARSQAVFPPPSAGSFLPQWHRRRGELAIMRAVPAKLQLSVALAVFLLVVTSCQYGAGQRPQPAISTVQSGAKCDQGDHAYDDAKLGWAFCYPGTWRFNERFQRSDAPLGTDATFDVINEPPCGSPPLPGARPVCPPDAGL